MFDYVHWNLWPQCISIAMPNQEFDEAVTAMQNNIQNEVSHSMLKIIFGKNLSKTVV